MSYQPNGSDNHARWSAEDEAEIERVFRAGLSEAAKLTSEQRIGLLRHEMLRRFATNCDIGVSVVVLGPTGCGKSMAAHEHAARLLRKHVTRHPVLQSLYPSVRIFKATALGGQVAYGQVVHDPGELVDTACKVDLAIIDDLGWESDIGVQAIRAVLEWRYDHGMPTCITSGRTIDQLSERYSDGVVRRMRECQGRRGYVLDLHGKQLEQPRRIDGAVPSEQQKPEPARWTGDRVSSEEIEQTIARLWSPRGL